MFKYLKAILKRIYLKYLYVVKKLPPSIGEYAFPMTDPDFIKERLSEEWLNFSEYKFNSGKIILNPWPFGYLAAFNLNFDDMCPIYSEINAVDFGGNENKGINRQLNEILTEFNELKITHFVIPNLDVSLLSKHLNQSYSADFSLDDPKYSSWVIWLKDYWLKKGHEIAIHGYSHYNKKVLIKRHCEFAYTLGFETQKKIENSLKIFDNINIPTYGFRPPGWDMSTSLDLVNIIKKFGLSYIAASSIDAGLNYSKRRVSNIYPDIFQNKILNIPQNLTFDMSTDDMITLAKIIIDRNGIISLKGHYTSLSNFDNSITKRNIDNVKNFLKYLKEKYDGKLWFATMKDIAERWITLSHILIYEKSNAIYIKNNSKKPISNLSLRILINSESKCKNLDLLYPSDEVYLMDAN